MRAWLDASSLPGYVTAAKSFPILFFDRADILRLIFMLCAIASWASANSTIDRIAAVVGKRAIKQSDIERDLRVIQFLNSEPPTSSLPLQKQTLKRLIDQELIRAGMGSAVNTNSSGTEAQALYDRLVRDRFGGSKEKVNAELRRRGLKETELLQQLQWQLVVLRFIDERFRSGILVTDDEIREYYDQHQQEFARQPGSHSFEALAPKIRETLEAQAVDQQFDEWLAQRRRRALIEYKVESLK